MPVCALCKSDRELRDSHVIPQFVFDRIKTNSPTGYLRAGLVDVNRRRQDGDKQKLLCGNCEERFSIGEKEFAEQIFARYHESGMTSFEYGPWLNYFISSVNWRTLHLDNIGFHEEKHSRETLSILDDAERTFADFLLEGRRDIGEMENHILPMFEITDSDSSLKEPNFCLRISAFGYTYIIPDIPAFYVCADLAGVLLFTLIRKPEDDVWENTRVEPSGGLIRGPQRINSPVVPHMIQQLSHAADVQVSQIQKSKIAEALAANPRAEQAKAVQFRKMDARMRRE